MWVIYLAMVSPLWPAEQDRTEQFLSQRPSKELMRCIISIILKVRRHCFHDIWYFYYAQWETHTQRTSQLQRDRNGDRDRNTKTHKLNVKKTTGENKKKNWHKKDKCLANLEWNKHKYSTDCSSKFLN